MSSSAPTLKDIQKQALSDPRGAIRALDNYLEHVTDGASVAHLVKGALHFELDEYEQAAPHFEEALRGDSRDGMASAGLFHSLWSQGKQFEALEEVKRYFLSVGFDSDSETASDYRAILAELNADA